MPRAPPTGPARAPAARLDSVSATYDQRALGSTSFRSVLAAAVLALAGASVVLELWHADMHVPFAYDRDALQNLLIIKGTLAHGWPLTNAQLGAPFGAQ